MNINKKLISLLFASILIINDIFICQPSIFANDIINKNPELIETEKNLTEIYYDNNSPSLNSTEAVELEKYLSPTSWPINTDYTKIGDEVYGKTGDINTIFETVWRGDLDTSNLIYDHNKYDKLAEKTKLYFLEYGKIAFTRFKNSNGKTIDISHFLAIGNTGGNKINVDYSKVTKSSIDIVALENILGVQDAIGYNQVLNIQDFKDTNKRTIQYIESFEVSCKETSEIEYILTCETKNGDIEKFAFNVEQKPLSLHDDTNGSHAKITFTYRDKYFNNMPTYKLINYNSILKTEDLPYPNYRVFNMDSSNRTYKKINGWYYDNRHHEHKYNKNILIKKNIDLYASYNIGTRTKGNNRYETANLVAEAFKQSDDIVLVSGENFADALSSSTLAYLKSAPILLTKKDSLATDTLNVIQNLKPKTITIIGGPNSVSENIVATLEREVYPSSSGNLEINRIKGKNRYETSTEVANEILKDRDYIESIAIVNGLDYPDGISAINLGNRYGSPIILSNSKNADSINELINKFSIQNSYIVGGSASVQTEFENSLNTLTTRLSGKSRYETNMAVVNEMSFKNHSVTLVSGDNYADALTAGPSAGLRHANVFLVNNSSIHSKELIKNLQKWGVHETFTVGGDSWISFDTEVTLTNIGALNR